MDSLSPEALVGWAAIIPTVALPFLPENPCIFGSAVVLTLWPNLFLQFSNYYAGTQENDHLHHPFWAFFLALSTLFVAFGTVDIRFNRSHVPVTRYFVYMGKAISLLLLGYTVQTIWHLESTMAMSTYKSVSVCFLALYLGVFAAAFQLSSSNPATIVLRRLSRHRANTRYWPGPEKQKFESACRIGLCLVVIALVTSLNYHTYSRMVAFQQEGGLREDSMELSAWFSRKLFQTMMGIWAGRTF